MLPDLTVRSSMTELMDDPDCPEELLIRTVRQFASINRLVSRYRSILKQWVLDEMLREPGRVYHLVDMGAGGCDIGAWLLNQAHSMGLNLRITAADLDERILQYARNTYDGVRGLHIVSMDLLHTRPPEPVDFVFANHFLHHLGNQEIIHLLRFWQPHVRRRLIFSDLERHPGAYLGYSLLSLFYTDSFARHDGLMSIRRGFRAGELDALTREALPDTACDVHRLAIGRLVCCIEGTAA